MNQRIAICIGILAGIILICSILLTKNLSLVDLGNPKENSYRTDEMLFLKTFYEIKQGKSYYSAFQTAYDADARKIKLTNDTFTWRLPTVFYFWTISAKTGNEILRNFWILVFVFLTCTYFLVKKVTNVFFGILAVILVVPYFADIIHYPTSILFTEWWALFPLLIGLTLFVYKHTRLAWIFFLLSIFARELIAIPIIFLTIFSIKQKSSRIYFVSLLMGFCLLIFLHSTAIHFAIPFTNNSSLDLISHHLHTFDRSALEKMIAFSMRSYPLVQLRINLAFVVVSLIGLVLSIWNKKESASRRLIFIIPWSMLLIFPWITTGKYNDYWGILFMPLIIIGCSVSLFEIYTSVGNYLHSPQKRAVN